MPRTTYILSLTAAVALGAGVASIDDFTAKAALTQTRNHIVTIELNTAAVNTIENFIQTRACPTVDSELGLSGSDSCNVSRDLSDVRISWVAGPTVDEEGNPLPPSTVVQMQSRFRLAGTWTPGAPQ